VLGIQQPNKKEWLKEEKARSVALLRELTPKENTKESFFGKSVFKGGRKAVLHNMIE